jgi:hypothetical protein
MESSGGLLFGKCVLLRKLVAIHALFLMQRTGQRRQPILVQDDTKVLLLPEIRGEAFLGLLGGGYQCLPSRVTNKLLLGFLRAADAQQADHIALGHYAEPRIRTARVAFPVRVVGEVGRGECDGVVVLQRVEGARCWIAELRVERDAIRARGVDGEESADAFPDASGLNSVFLVGLISVLYQEEGKNSVTLCTPTTLLLA